MPSVVAVPSPAAPSTDRRAEFSPDASSLAAAVVLVLSATTLILAQLDARRGRDYQLHTLLLASDLALLVLVLVAGRGLPAAVRGWRAHRCAVAGLAVGLAMVPAALVHPSDRGAAALLRWAGAIALALAVASAGRDGRRLVLGALALVSLTHVVVALAQRANGGPLGLGSLGEAGAVEIGGRIASTGLTVHPYLLAAWCTVAGTALILVGRRLGPAGRLATVAGVVAFAGIGLTMSRAGVVAAVLALGALAVSARRPGDGAWRKVVVAAGAAFALGMLLNAPSWASRAGEATAGDVEDVSNGRGALLRQAWPLLRDDPITGVGPGRYVLALSEHPDLVALSDQSPRPVHVTPLLLVVEGGILVVPALLLLAAAIGRACWRGGAAAVALTLALLPFLALDHLAWSYPQGIILTGLWLGALDLLSTSQDQAPPAELATE